MPINSFDNYPMSWRPDKSRLKQPYYISLADTLEEDILSGVLPPHTKLPPQRELADFLDMGLSTITRAFNICENRGLLYATVGRGTFVSPNAGASIELAERAGTAPIIEMGILRPLDRFNQIVEEVVADVACRGYVSELLDYKYAAGSPYHIDVFKNWLENTGVLVGNKNMTITFGAQNAVMIALISLFEPGDRIAVDKFTYTNFIILAKHLQLQLVPLVSDAYGMDAEKLRQACSHNQIRGIYMMPSCCNPTGIMMSPERKRAIASIIEEFDLITLENGIYDFLMPEDDAPLQSLAPENTIYITSFSKSISSGLRVGAAVIPERYSKKYEQGFFSIDIKASAFSSEVLVEMLLNGKATEIISEKVRIMQKRNARFDDLFGHNDTNINPASYFRWLKIPTGYTGNIETYCRERGVSVIDSDRFTVGQVDPANRFIRVALCSPASESEIKSGLEVLKDIT